MPGVEYFLSQTSLPPTSSALGTPTPYHNLRLDPKYYREGPLSHDPATRLRQMLARPGIVVSDFQLVFWRIA